MLFYRGKRYTCALDLGFEQIRGKWKAVLLCHLADGPQRFLALQRLTGGISQKVLNQALREMEDEGLLRRQPPRVEYSLAPKGAALVPALRQIEAWAKQYCPAAMPADPHQA